jgi:capsular polysaccharide biosynthesis protein
VEHRLSSSSYAEIARERIWFVLGVGFASCVVAALVAFGVSMMLPKAYESRAAVLVGSLTETTSDRLTAYQQLAQTYAELATTTPILLEVILDLDLDETPVDLAERVSVRAPVGQNLVTITATAPSPVDALRLANSVAEQVTRLATPADGSPSLAAIVQPAVAPGGPSSPRILLNTVIAGLLGAALGLGVALLVAASRRA